MNRMLLAAALALPVSAAIAAAPAPSGTQDNELVLECARALDIAASKGTGLPVQGHVALADFERITKRDANLRKQAEKAVDGMWADYRKTKGREAFDRYVLSVAEDCSDLYVQRDAKLREAAAKPKVSPENELNSLGTLSAGALRAFVQRTGNAPAVADYLIYHYPYGKDLFKPNEDGDYLAQLILQAGPAGVKRFSDEAVYAIANKHYWQYNPPATRLIFDEYRRRMRQMRQNEDEARRWAQRAADDRARQARSANARPVGSLGSGNVRVPQGNGVVTCTTYKGPNGGTVCKEGKR